MRHVARGHGGGAAPRRAESERPPIEIKKPTPPSNAPLLVLAALVGIAAGVSAFFAFQPDPCQGTNFESDNFGYCLVVPEGWEAGPAQFGAGRDARPVRPAHRRGDRGGRGGRPRDRDRARAVVNFVRQRDEDAGLTPGPASESDLDGTDALQWDVSVSAEDGETFLMREVVTVKGDVGWRVTLNDLQDGFDTSAVVFNDMLESWQFSDAAFGAPEELQHPLEEVGRGALVVVGQARVDEQVLVALVQEQVGVLRRPDDLAGGVEVALCDPLVVLHHVDLERDALGPQGVELGRRECARDEHRPFAPGASGPAPAPA